MDVLADTLRVIRLTGAIFVAGRFSAPWSLQSPSAEGYVKLLNLPGDCITLFHIVVSGECWFSLDGQPAFRAEASDVVIFPHAEAHVMGSHPQALPGADISRQALNFSKALQPNTGIPQFELIRGDQITQLVCGYLHCDQRFNPLNSALPNILVVRAAHHAGAACANGAGSLTAECILPVETGDWLDTTRDYMIEEAVGERVCSSAMLPRLTELFFVEVLRRYMQQLPPEQTGWLAGLRDPDIGQVLQLMHSQPERAWTVEELAQAVALSRSALAQRFTALLGVSPMHYLLNWRMQLAQALLEQPDLSLRTVADRVGYESEVAFHRAFKRTVGQPPATWRRQGEQKNGYSVADHKTANSAAHAA